MPLDATGNPTDGTEAVVEVIAEIAKGDASAGWVFGLIASHFWLVCLFPQQAQEEMSFAGAFGHGFFGDGFGTAHLCRFLVCQMRA